jgi:hypothetical protein
VAVNKILHEAYKRVVRLGGAGVSISGMLKDLLLALALLLVVINHPTPLVLRQFHTEGFVNQHVHDPAQTGKLVFTTEAIEHIPAGWRARETYVAHGTDEFEEIFELAGPGKDFELYSHARLKRVR